MKALQPWCIECDGPMDARARTCACVERLARHEANARAGARALAQSLDGLSQQAKDTVAVAYSLIAGARAGE